MPWRASALASGTAVWFLLMGGIGVQLESLALRPPQLFSYCQYSSYLTANPLYCCSTAPLCLQMRHQPPYQGGRRFWSVWRSARQGAPPGKLWAVTVHGPGMPWQRARCAKLAAVASLLHPDAASHGPKAGTPPSCAAQLQDQEMLKPILNLWYCSRWTPPRRSSRPAGPTACGGCRWPHSSRSCSRPSCRQAAAVHVVLAMPACALPLY